MPGRGGRRSEHSPRWRACPAGATAPSGFIAGGWRVDRHPRLKGHQDWSWPVVTDPSGDLLATGDRAGVLRLWDVASGALRHALTGHTAAIYWVAFSPSGGM